MRWFDLSDVSPAENKCQSMVSPLWEMWSRYPVYSRVDMKFLRVSAPAPRPPTRQNLIFPTTFHPSYGSMKFQVLLVLASSLVANDSFVVKRSIKDESVSDYLTERICWWNEVCKEEFQTQFRCKCPTWSFCRSPGRYYNAFCSVAETGYIWNQPAINWGISVDSV